MEATVLPSAQGLLEVNAVESKISIHFTRKYCMHSIPSQDPTGKNRSTVNRVSKNRKEKRLVRKVECKGEEGLPAGQRPQAGQPCCAESWDPVLKCQYLVYH